MFNIKNFICLCLVLCAYNLTTGQITLRQNGTYANYFQARDLNVVNGSATPNGGSSTSMSVFGAETSTDWNGTATLNLPSGVSYGLGFTIDNSFSTSNTGDAYALQIVGSSDNISLFYRFNKNAWEGGTSSYNGWGSWYKIWNSGDDGTGSGLDADLVRGQAPQWTTNSSTVYNTNSGNVLIGKTSQTNTTYKLDVNGNIRANQVVVNTTGADFVFDPTYRLPSIDSLENYIQLHHHLPGIPAAEQMQREGLNVGGNQVKLLQKVEELTLYIIDQDNHIRDQQQAIQQLKEALKAQDEQINALEAKMKNKAN